jgi:hypothetical protein
VAVNPDPQHLQRQAYEQFRLALDRSETTYALFWASKGNPGIKEYSYVSIVNGSKIWIGDTCRMLQDILECTPGIANKLAWAMFAPEKVTNPRGGIAALHLEDAITLCTECSKWAHKNQIPLSFTLTTVRPLV